MKSSIKVSLITPPSSCVEDDRVDPPLGLLYIAAQLLENGYQDVVISDLTGCKDDEEIADKIKTIPWADVYGISCLCTNYHNAKKS